MTPSTPCRSVVDLVDREPVDGGESPPFEVQLTGPGAGQEVGRRHDERATGDQRLVLADAIEVEPIAEPVAVIGVRPPESDDLELDDVARGESAGQPNAVAEAEAERRRGTLGQGRLERMPCPATAPAARRQAGMAFDVLEARQTG